MQAIDSRWHTLKSDTEQARATLLIRKDFPARNLYEMQRLWAEALSRRMFMTSR